MQETEQAVVRVGGIGAPFWDYPSLISFLKANAKSNGDNVLVFDGPEGAGKSTAAMHLVLDLDEDFDPLEDTIFDFEDFVDKFQSQQRGRTYLLDEGGNLAFNRDFSKGENKLLVKLLMMSRIINATLVINCPRFDSLDLYVREHRCRIRIHVPAYFSPYGMVRGKAIVKWRVTTETGMSWWEDVFELRFTSLSAHPAWRPYEQVKVAKVEAGAKELLQLVTKAKKES